MLVVHAHTLSKLLPVTTLAMMNLPEKAAYTSSQHEGQKTPGSIASSEDGKTTMVEQNLQHEQEVLDLVRKFTSQSAQHNHGSPFEAAEGSHLDPKSDQFRAKSWAKSFYELRYSSKGAVARVAGVAFKNLNVWGKGSPTDFQSTVGNTLLKLPSLFGRGTQKIDILQDLDGLLLPGEQLCVLGPPG